MYLHIVLQHATIYRHAAGVSTEIPTRLDSRLWYGTGNNLSLLGKIALSAHVEVGIIAVVVANTTGFFVGVGYFVYSTNQPSIFVESTIHKCISTDITSSVSLLLLLLSRGRPTPHTPMTKSLPTGTGLQVMSVSAFSLIIFAILSLYYLFTQMDLSRSVELSDKLDLHENSPDDSKTSSLTSDSTTDDNDGTSKPGRRYLTQYRRIVLMLTVGIITILVYLILVFSNAPSWLEWVGMLIVLVLLGPILQYGDEIRRQRYDRLSLLLTLVCILATGLNLAVYAANQYADEDIYKGPARIISYQDESYNNAADETVTRTDLMVAWGGEWGCPHNPGMYCEAAVPGALCDSKNYYNRKRHLQQDDNNNDNDNNNEEGGGADDNGADENVEGQDAEGGGEAQDAAEEDGDAAAGDGAESYEQLQQDYEDLEQKYEDLQDKYDALQEQNQNLQNDLVSAENIYLTHSFL